MLTAFTVEMQKQSERDCQWLGINGGLIDRTGLLYVWCKFFANDLLEKCIEKSGRKGLLIVRNSCPTERQDYCVCCIEYTHKIECVFRKKKTKHKWLCGNCSFNNNTDTQTLYKTIIVIITYNKIHWKAYMMHVCLHICWCVCQEWDRMIGMTTGYCKEKIL